jgi:hypothetical protein
MTIQQLMANYEAHASASCHVTTAGIPIIIYKGESYTMREFNEVYSTNPIRVSWGRQLNKGDNYDRTKDWLLKD